MKQIYHHFKKWEDYQNGMYATVNATSGHDLIIKAVEILGTPTLCRAAMERVVSEWPHATEHNLTNTGLNRRAWLGQAACCIMHKTPESLTKIAWGELSEDQQNKANEIAEYVIEQWEIKHMKHA
jgi:hypothetical protein